MDARTYQKLADDYQRTVKHHGKPPVDVDILHEIWILSNFGCWPLFELESSAAEVQRQMQPIYHGKNAQGINFLS